MANGIVQVGPDRERLSTKQLLLIGRNGHNVPAGIPSDPRKPFVSAAKRLHYVGGNLTVQTYRLLALPSSMLQIDSGLLLHKTQLKLTLQYAHCRIHHRDCTCVSLLCYEYGHS